MTKDYKGEIDARFEEFELRALSLDAAFQLLTNEAGGVGQDPELTRFATRTIQRSLGDREMSEDFDAIIGGFIRETEEFESARASRFVAEFVGNLLDHPVHIRSNSRKMSSWSVLLSAACTLDASQDEDEGGLWEKFAEMVARADPVCDEVTPENFRKMIINAFEVVVRHPRFSFFDLAKALKAAQADALARRCLMSRASEKFYR